MMIDRCSAERFSIRAAKLALLLALPGCGLLITKRDFDVQTKRQAQQYGQVATEVTTLRGDLAALRTRIENALRANANAGSELLGDRERLAKMAGRADELANAMEEVRKELGTAKAELGARIDELRKPEVASIAPLPPHSAVPQEKGAHLAAVRGAHEKRDFASTKALGREYLTRYPSDEADEALFLVGDAELGDGRPSSALAEFNRLLRQYPRSRWLEKTLFAMGEAYLLMHDCSGAKLAFGSCAQRFPREKSGLLAKEKIAQIEKKPPGLCAP